MAFLVCCCLTLAGCFSSGGVTPIQTAYNRGVAFYSAGEYDRAIHEFREALRNDPNDVRARFNLALSLETQAHQAPSDQRQRLTDEAVEQYQRLLDADPKHLEARVNLAAITYEHGDIGSAIVALEGAVADYPKAVAPRAALAGMYLRSDDPQTARVIVLDAQKLDPADPRLSILRGDCERALGNDSGAADAYAQALRTVPDDIGALLALARVQLRLHRAANARANAQRVLFIDNDNWAAHVITAEAAERQGDLDAAAYHLAKARALDHQRSGGSPQIDYDARLARLYRQLADQLEGAMPAAEAASAK